MVTVHNAGEVLRTINKSAAYGKESHHAAGLAWLGGVDDFDRGRVSPS